MSDENFVTLYHHTSPEAAVQILRDRKMMSNAPVNRPWAHFSTWPDGNAAGMAGYGEAIVEVRLPRELLVPEDRFHSGEEFFTVPLADLRPEHFVSAHLLEPPPEERDLMWLAEQMEVHTRELGPSAPSYHWHSVVEARGWEQPRLDGGHGGVPYGFCAADGADRLRRGQHMLERGADSQDGKSQRRGVER